MRIERLTKAQISHVEWALGGMEDYVGEEECDYAPADLPQVEGSALVFPTGSKEAADDLVYRLEVQLPEMAEKNGSSVSAATRLVARVREAFAKRGIEIEYGGGYV